MYQSFKYRLYPFRSQEMELLRQLDELKFLHNYALEQRIDAWRTEKRSVGYTEQAASLTQWRNYDRNGIGRVHSQVAQECLQRIADSYKHFFRRLKEGTRPGFPHFRSEVTSLTYPQAYSAVTITEGRMGTKRLHLSKIGDVPIELHRQPVDGRIKTCTVKREGDRWYAVLTVEIPDAPTPPATSPVNPVGIDLGLNRIATLSTGETVDPPRFLRKAEKRLKRLDREVSRRVKHSHNREKAKLRRARYFAKIRDRRRDFAHKLTTRWTSGYDLIAFEDLNVRSMIRGLNNAKSISDAGWGMLRQMSEYKQLKRSHRYVEVSARNTTQTCSTCGEYAYPPLELKDRVFRCPNGHVEDRDINAARNVVARALAAVGQDMPEFTLVETGPPPARMGRRVRSKKQEPPQNTLTAQCVL